MATPRKKRKPKMVGVSVRLRDGGYIQPTLSDDILQIVLSGDVVRTIEDKKGSVLLTFKREDLDWIGIETVPIKATVRMQVPEGAVLGDDY